jgi:hypothetical protein
MARKGWKKKSGDENPPSSPWEIEDLIGSGFEACQLSYETGNYGALMDALVLCSEKKIPLPEWLALALIDLVKSAAKGFPSMRRGNLFRWEARIKHDLIDMKRSETVMELRESGVFWSDVYGHASEILEKTESWAAGGEEAIQKSYKRFKRNVKLNPGRYYLPESIKLRDLIRVRK